MNNIGLKSFPRSPEPFSAGQPKPEVGVPWYGSSSDAHRTIIILKAGTVLLLARANHLNLVSPAPQMVDELAQRHGDAIHFGGIGFGYERYIHVVRCIVVTMVQEERTPSGQIQSGKRQLSYDEVKSPNSPPG